MRFIVSGKPSGSEKLKSAVRHKGAWNTDGPVFLLAVFYNGDHSARCCHNGAIQRVDIAFSTVVHGVLNAQSARLIVSAVRCGRDLAPAALLPFPKHPCLQIIAADWAFST